MELKLYKTAAAQFRLLFFNKRTYSFICFFAIIIMANLGNAQEKRLAQITPKSPNVASLNKIIEFPVSLSTGTVNSNIPIYEIEVDGVRLPISLSYSNNGLKCDEIPSWVGEGWNLYTGGYISYEKRGNYDFDPTAGMFAGGSTLLNSYFNNQMTVQQKQFYFEDIINGSIDSEYDIYKYNFLQNIGSFHFLSSNTVRTNPKVDFLVSNQQNGIHIKDDKGNLYKFENKETVVSVNPLDISSDFSGTSAFYLTQIVTKNGKVINFSYKTYALRYYKTNDYVMYNIQDCDVGVYNPGVGSSTTMVDIAYLLPDEISYPLGKVKFIHSNQKRLDLVAIDPNSNVPYLQAIEVYDNERKIRDFALNTSFYGGNGRLQLHSIKEKLGEREWDFGYYPGSTAIFSKAKDHWGYFNGYASPNNIPKADYHQFVTGYTNYFIPQANRTSNFDAAKAGVLKSIKYPEKGYVEFDYEPNMFTLQNTSEFNFEPFMKPQVSSGTYSEYTVPIASVDAYEGATYSGSFTIPKKDYYYYRAYKNLSSDYMYMDSDVKFTDPNTNLLIGKLMDPLQESCNFNTKTCFYEGIIELPAGTYNYTVSGSYYLINNGQSTFWLHAGFSIAAKPAEAPILSYPVGGGRVSKISWFDKPGAIPVVKRYVYDDYIPNVQVPIPNYMISKEMMKTTYVGNLEWPVCSVCAIMTTVYEESVSAMVGPSITYKNVVEFDGITNTNGKIEREYYMPDYIGSTSFLPVVPPINSNPFAGEIYKENIKPTGTNPLSVQETKNNFSVDYQGTQLNGIRVAYDRYCQDFSQRTYNVNLSTLISANAKPISAIVTKSGVETSKNFFYNVSKHHSLSSTSEISSDDKNIKTKYLFDFDGLPSTGVSWVDNLYSAHINAPIEQIKIKSKGGIEYVVEAMLYIYHDDKPHLKEVLKLVFPSPILASTFSEANIINSQFIYDNRYLVDITFTKYDINGNVVEINNRGVKTSYVYSYKGEKPVAEIHNADYASVVSVLGQSGVDSFSSSIPTDAEVKSFLEGLRNNPSMKNAQVTTYTFKPLVGITSLTDAKGISTYYEYDASGRLKLEKDHHGNVIKSYCYNYAGQQTSCATPLPQIYANTAQSQSFTKNDCLSGEQGSLVIYTVAAGQYSSSLSQAAADALALADISANGQNYANSNGTCVQVSACKRYSISMPLSESNNLYIRYKPCGSSTYVTSAVWQLEQDPSMDNEMVVMLCTETPMYDVWFMYGEYGPSQIINGLSITEIGSCQ